jgi:hypothetical protein
MKRIISILTFVMLTGMIAGTESAFSNTGGPSPAGVAKKVEVYYFHFTRRCMTCNNVEKVSKEAVEKQFPDKVKTGEVSFKSVNLEEKEGEAIGEKYKIEGQTLVVISGDKRVDLTDKGFLWANDSPAKLKAEIKKAVEGFLK